MAWAYILFYKVVILSKDKDYKVVILSKDKDYNSRLKKPKTVPIKERVANNHLFLRRKRVLISVMRNAWNPQPSERLASLLNS